MKEFLVSPSASLIEYGLDFNIALDMYFQTDLIDGSSFEFFPQLQISKHLVKNILFVGGGIRSVRVRNTIKSLSDENPYIIDLGTNQINEQDIPVSLNLKSTDIKNELYYKWKMS